MLSGSLFKRLDKGVLTKGGKVVFFYYFRILIIFYNYENTN